MPDPITIPAPDTQPISTRTPPDPDPKTPDLVKAVEGLIAKHGDSTAALRVLLAENHSYRDQLRETKAKLPADGSLVLAGDDARDWSTYRQLGKPSELRKAIEEGSTATAERDALRKAGTIREAAELHGYKPSVLLTLAEKLDVGFADVKGADGKVTRKAVIKLADPEGKAPTELPLDDYATKHWADFLPALKTEVVKVTPGTPPRTQTQPPRAPIVPEVPRRRLTL